MGDNLSPAHVQSLRWILLQAAKAAAPLSATEQMCLDVAAAAYPAAGAKRVRIELEYLEASGLVGLERSEIRPWTVKLTSQGRDVIDYAADAPAGVRRPPMSD